MRISDIAYFASEYARLGTEYENKRQEYIKIKKELDEISYKQEEMRESLRDSVSQTQPMRVVRLNSNYVMIIQWTSLLPTLSVKQIEVG